MKCAIEDRGVFYTVLMRYFYNFINIYKDAPDEGVICLLCGEVFERYSNIQKHRNMFFKHVFEDHQEWLLVEVIREWGNFKSKDRLPLKRFNKVHIKPWKDPESLFCDVDFLSELVGKRISKFPKCSSNDLKIEGDK